MANTVRLKRSAVQGKAPVVGDLALGELAVNTYDGKLYTKKNDGTDAIVEIGGAVTSVNTLTGAVSLGIEDMDDYQPQPATHPNAYHSDKQADGNWTAVKNSTLGAYCFEPVSGNYTGITINKFDATSGTSLDTQGFVGGTTLNLWVSADGVTFTQHTATNSYTQGTKNALFTGFSPDLSSYTSASALYFSLSAPGGDAPLVNGDILQYESATSKFRPVQLPSSDVTSVNTQTGAVVLDADDIDDTSTTHKFATATQLSAADSALQPGDIGVTVQGYDADTAKYDDVTANFTGTLQNGGSNVLVDTDIGSTVQAYDANLPAGNTILVDGDVGVTVQGYDADTAKYDAVTANFTGTLQNGGSNVVVDSDIGSTVQAYDADNVVTDVAPTFTTTVQTTERTITTGAFDLSTGNHWTCGAITVPAPTNATAGTSGLIRITAGTVVWNAVFKFPGGAAPTIASYPAIIPFYVQDSSNILMGNVAEGIS